ncbi:winged helix-turn-helix domain-containing protein [Micromonospora sp. 4G57]|uniref:Winged helix-turn-helix domain-containing protein n=1 Tax=Micromonospora sicca TaxID=2202420 RepID=A0ABU5JEE8_9ACTN|nr:MULTISPECIES: winged helix-turn-helix domain-containing protein [unclassified Micromonospora]MDZ5445158.1 winged helix-turn-helix domain-containing protein [Micromonospora sp. 4G57]MDZ5490965.1 winged helix-turn-helix domain-containing protein [Micromonospora sp. 4G53]
MSSNTRIPDYDLPDTVEASTPAQLRAIADPLRATILDLVLERAATVAELATAIGRPKSTVAHHVNVLLEAGMLRVVRTRRVRAIDERYYGRTGRTIHVGVVRRPGDTTTPVCVNGLSVAAAESVPAHEADTLYSTIRHARIPKESAAQFWRRVEALIREFTELPRSGDTVYGFVAGLYPTDHPTLPDPDQAPAGDSD